MKKEQLADQVKHYLSYKQLIHRNSHWEHQRRCSGLYHPLDRILHLPFILVSTKDSPSNEIDLVYSEDNTSVNIAMKEPFKCYGDADTLMQLGMYKVDEGFYKENVP
jgi:hypothetical protein